MTGGLGEGGWVTLISVAACLVLALASYRSYRIETGRTLRMMLVWATIIAAVTLFFSMVA